MVSGEFKERDVRQQHVRQEDPGTDNSLHSMPSVNIPNEEWLQMGLIVGACYAPHVLDPVLTLF